MGRSRPHREDTQRRHTGPSGGRCVRAPILPPSYDARVIAWHIRNIRRWNQIVRVLARHGFTSVLKEIGLGDMLGWLLDSVSLWKVEA